MRKLIIMIFVILLIFSLVSCGADGSNKTANSTNSIVVLPDQETKNTVNGYKIVDDEDSLPSDVLSSEVSSIAQSSNSSEVNSGENIVNYYVGNKNTKKFHNSNCRYAAKIKEENTVRFSNSDEATGQGYVPCSVCNP